MRTVARMSKMSRISLISLSLIAFFCVSTDAHALTLGQAAKVAQTAKPAAFQAVEMVAYQAEDRVPQWNRVKQAMIKDRAILQNCLDNADNCEGTAMVSWRDMVIGLKNQPVAMQASMVNSFFNRWQYRTDMETYGVSEYWASPIEFMTNSGDCEDYAIAKYITLSFLGVAEDQMRIVALVDNNRGGIGHSVLTVSVQGEEQVVLDNLTDSVYNSAQQTGYAPRFAVNQNNIYTYAQAPQVILATY